MDFRVFVYLIAPYLFFIFCWAFSIKRTREQSNSNLTKSSRIFVNWYQFELLTAIVFGFTLEWVGVHLLHYYEYGPSLISVSQIPLSTPIGWGVIIYSSMLMSDQISVPNWTRPFLDSFFAIQIDLSMDVVATRLGLWSWHYYPENIKWNQDWFGVPWGNFFTWIFTILFFSMILRWFRKSKHFEEKFNFKFLIIGLISIILSEVLLVFMLKLGEVGQYLGVKDYVIGSLPFLIIIPPSLYALKIGDLKAFYGPANYVFLFYHVYSFSILIFTDLIYKSDLLVLASSLVFLFSVGIHFLYLKNKQFFLKQIFNRSLT